MSAIILLSGKMGSGKTSVAKYFVDKYKFEYEKFAKPIYEILEKAGLKKNRKLMQAIGEIMRKYDSLFFTHALLRRIVQNVNNKNIIIDDWRFPNEYQLLDTLKSVLGKQIYKIRINVDEQTRIKRVREIYGDMSDDELNHESETALDNYDKFDLIINNDSLDYAIIELEKFLKEKGVI